jgi:hypothetical protein
MYHSFCGDDQGCRHQKQRAPADGGWIKAGHGFSGGYLVADPIVNYVLGPVQLFTMTSLRRFKPQS